MWNFERRCREPERSENQRYARSVNLIFRDPVHDARRCGQVSLWRITREASREELGRGGEVEAVQDVTLAAGQSHGMDPYGNRPDLAGLPFTFGTACRQTKTQAERFALAVIMARFRPGAEIVDFGRSEPNDFWK